MGEHSASPTGRPEPVALLDVAKLIVVVLTGTGWVVIPDTLINTVTSGVALVIFLALTVYTRSQVTPLSDPIDEDGRMLTVDELLDEYADEYQAEPGPDAAEAG